MADHLAIEHWVHGVHQRMGVHMLLAASKKKVLLKLLDVKVTK